MVASAHGILRGEKDFFFFFVSSVMRFHRLSVMDEGNNRSMAYSSCVLKVSGQLDT